MMYITLDAISWRLVTGGPTEAGTQKERPRALAMLGNDSEEEDARERHGRDKRGKHTEHEDECEALHDARPEPEENDTRNYHSEVSVSNCRPRSVEADMHRLARRLPCMQF